MHKGIIRLHTPSKTTCGWALREFGASCWSLLIAQPHWPHVVTAVYLRGMSPWHLGSPTIPFLFPKPKNFL